MCSIWEHSGCDAVQAITTYASNTRSASSLNYSHYTVELGFTNGITPAFKDGAEESVACGFCWNAAYEMCAPSRLLQAGTATFN